MLSDRIGFADLDSITALSLVGVIVLGATYFLCVDYPINVKVPVVGIGVRYTKWIAAVRNVWHARESIREGYAKYGDYAFQIPTMTRMDIFICDRKMTREYYTMDEDHLSFPAVMSEEFQFKWVMPGLHHDARKIPVSVIAKALSWQRTRASKPDDPFFRAFSQELVYGFGEEVQRMAIRQKSISSWLGSGTAPEPGPGWHLVPCFPLALKVIARLTTFSLFGERICRDPKFVDMCCEFGDAVPRDALILRPWPDWARLFLSKALTAPRLIRRLQKTVHAEMQNRRNSREQNPLKDILDYAMQWIDQHPEAGYDDWHVVDMMASTVFAALHTSSQLVVHCIFEIATRPEYLGPLREEIEQCFREHGKGSKKAIDSMFKMDSFIKETQRCNPLDASALARLAIKDYKFQNGLYVPKGSFIFTPNSPLYEDAKFYPNPQRFDGFRFARMRDDPQLKSMCDLTATSGQSMHFGTGRHACPGRYMVSDEVKLAMIHLLQNFNFRLEHGGARPKNMPFGKFMLPDMKARIWLKETGDDKS